MKQLSIYTLIVICSLSSEHAFSQWYFETGVNDSKFSDYTSNNPTTLKSFNGFRDFSHAVGYLLPAQKLQKSDQANIKLAALRYKVGIGFDHMNLKEKATQQGSEAFLHYDLAQLQVRMGVMFTPVLLRKRQADYFGIHQPAINLILDAGMAYNFYTSATRTLINGNGNITDLKVDDEFDKSYPAYVFGAGFEFPLNKYAALYAKYEFENAFPHNEDNQSSYEEKFRTQKKRVLFGLRIDFSLRNDQQRQQLNKIAALEASRADELAALRKKIAELEQAYKYVDTTLHNHIKNIDIHVQESQQDGALLNVQRHKKGFSFFPAFKHVLFPNNRSNFEKDLYASKLSSLALFLQKNTNYRIKLIGYADVKTGSLKYNKALSVKRAENIYNYLIKLGVPAQHMKYAGFGGTSKFSIDEKGENRRTEIIITE
jgi:outer membrane protein OmpA-like peptidoglycan-associated protein